MSCRKITSGKKISCKDCIYGWGRCGNIHGAYYDVPVYPFDTCPYAVAEMKGAEEMRVTKDNTLFIPDVNRIGSQLRRVRENKEMTIMQLSERSRITPAFICNVENGKKNLGKIDTLLSWIEALGYTNVVFIGE